MTVYSNNPIRIKITEKDLWNITHARGIDSCAYPVPETKDEFYIKFCCTDINPFNPSEEKYRDDIDREIEKLNVVQDVIREFKPNRRFNSRKSMVVESILDEKRFSIGNKYDVLLDKATNVHRLKNGKLFGIIQNE